MFQRSLGSFALAAALCLAVSGAQAFDESKYPNWKGQWVRIGGGGQWDTTKPPVRGQQPPITEEYRAIWEKNIAEGIAGGQYYNPQVRCLPGGMPRMMFAYEPMEVIVLPDTTYILQEYVPMIRRVYTDGRDFPTDEEPAFLGYSIGKWVDEDNDGKFDVLEIETRNMKGPRSFDASGIPVHADNQTVVKERIWLDKTDKNLLRNEITTTDSALTRPWTVMKTYRRDLSAKPIWFEYVCAEGNHHVVVGKNNYFISGDGYLMPTRKDQAPPDLKFFSQRPR